jgi:hypothetical protein
MASRYANRPISVRLYADRVVTAAEGPVIAEHIRRTNRSHDGGQAIYDWRPLSDPSGSQQLRLCPECGR